MEPSRSGAAEAYRLVRRPLPHPHAHRPRSKAGKLVRAENLKAFAFSGRGLAAVERDELEGAGLVLGSDEGSADVKGVGGPERVAAHDALGVTPDDIGRGHLGPALPRIQKVAPHQTQLADRRGFVAAAPRERGW